jgi:MoxR-like ATPase
MMHLKVDYPEAEAELQILELAENEARQTTTADAILMSQEQLFQARQEVLGLYMADSIKDYIVQLVIATRQGEKYSQELADWIAVGVSPRATISLSLGARAHAWLNGQEFVTPDNVQAVIHDVFRHRLLLNFEAQAQNLSEDDITDKILQLVPVA